LLLGFSLVAEAQTSIPNGRIDRTVDVEGFDDFEIYLPDSTESLSIYAQWSNGRNVVVDDVTLLCLYGPDGLDGGAEDDDLTISDSRAVSYKTIPGRFWYATSVSGQQCWISLNFRHRDGYDLAAQARFTVILSELDATEDTWEDASAHDLLLLQEKRSLSR